jgi:hypothetical protein
MTETVSAPETQTPPSPVIPRPATDHAALRAIEEAEDHLHQRALAIRADPESHKIIANVMKTPGAGQPAAN